MNIPVVAKIVEQSYLDEFSYESELAFSGTLKKKTKRMTLKVVIRKDVVNVNFVIYDHNDFPVRIIGNMKEAIITYNNLERINRYPEMI